MLALALVMLLSSTAVTSKADGGPECPLGCPATGR